MIVHGGWGPTRLKELEELNVPCNWIQQGGAATSASGFHKWFDQCNTPATAAAKLTEGIRKRNPLT